MAIGFVNVPSSSGGGGKRTARFVIGTSTSGHTAKDCDYLCDGTQDNVEINAAIQDLPASGGEIVILDGTYNIAAAIRVDKPCVTISGSGSATVLKRMYNESGNVSYTGSWDNDDAKNDGGVLCVQHTDTLIRDLSVDGNKTSFTNNYNHGIFVDGLVKFGSGHAYLSHYVNTNNRILNVSVKNCAGSGIYVRYNEKGRISHALCSGNNKNGIFLGHTRTTSVRGCVCENNGSNGIYDGYALSVQNFVWAYDASVRFKNVITENILDNNAVGIYLDSCWNVVANNILDNTTQISYANNSASSNNTVNNNLTSYNDTSNLLPDPVP